MGMYVHGFVYLKGIRKKLRAATTKRLSADLSVWIEGIINHIHWAADTSEGNGELMKAKWLSLSRHICDIHDGHSEVYPQCQHGLLDNRPWLEHGK